MILVTELTVCGHPIPIFVGDPGEGIDACFEYEPWHIIMSPKLEGASFLQRLMHEWRHARHFMDYHEMPDDQEEAMCDDFARCALEVMGSAERIRLLACWDIARDALPSAPSDRASSAHTEERPHESQEPLELVCEAYKRRQGRQGQ